MNGAPYIPGKTAEKMNGGHVKGQRHAAMIEIAMPLLGNGMAPQAVFSQLRATFPDADKTDKEILDVVNWCADKNPTPSGYGDAPAPQARRPLAIQKPAKLALSPQDAVTQAIGGQSFSEEWWREKGDPIPTNPAGQTRALFETLYSPEDRVNLVKEFFIADDGKPKPHGGGASKTRDGWLRHFEQHGLPVSDSGIWIRPNPCGPGTGKEGSITDADILAFRFAFLESDILSMSDQLSFFAITGLPIAAIVTSGGNSCHAWVRIDAESLEEYRTRVKALYDAIDGYGMDKANKNASRLSRLGGAHRKLGGVGDGIQRVIFLDSKARGSVLTSAFLESMKANLAKPPVSRSPLQPAILAAADRYEELLRNKGKTGVPTGLKGFDKISGGLKKKRLYVLAAESKCGKSSLAYNIANHATQNKHPTAVFSMEMDQDEVVDMLMAMEGPIDRNVFNTGEFDTLDFTRIVETSKKLANQPLYIFDSPLQTMESIREETMRLKSTVGLDLVIVDYLQLVTPSAEYKDNREQQIATIGMGLRRLCVDADVPVIALSQINDDGKLRESRAVGHTAHCVMILEEIEPTEDAKTRFLRLKIERARAMPRGSFAIVFEPYYCRMYEGDHEIYPAPKTKQGDIRRTR